MTAKIERNKVDDYKYWKKSGFDTTKMDICASCIFTMMKRFVPLFSTEQVNVESLAYHLTLS